MTEKFETEETKKAQDEILFELSARGHWPYAWRRMPFGSTYSHLGSSAEPLPPLAVQVRDRIEHPMSWYSEKKGVYLQKTKWDAGLKLIEWRFVFIVRTLDNIWACAPVDPKAHDGVEPGRAHGRTDPNSLGDCVLLKRDRFVKAEQGARNALAVQLPLI